MKEFFNLNFRRLLKSKTFYTGLAAIITGIGLYVSGDKTNGIQTIFGGLGLIFLRQASIPGK